MRSIFEFIDMAIKKLEVPLVGDVNEDEARITLAVKLYREGKMRLKQAADISKLSLGDFLYELGKRKIRYTNITIVELQEELKET